MKASDVRAQWSQLLNKVFRSKTRVVVEKSGIPVAAVISAEDLQMFTQMEEQREKRFKALDKMREAFKGVPQEEIGRKVKRAISQVRAKNRAKRN